MTCRTSGVLRRFCHPVLIALGVILAGCLDVETTTEVRRDGSLVRTVVFTGDASHMERGEAIYRIDSLWQISVDTTSPDRRRVSATRTFLSSDAMAEALGSGRGGQLTIRPRLEASFAWFFTHYRYAEVWQKLSGPDSVPLSEYLSPAEVDLITRHVLRKEPFTVLGDSLAVDDATDRFDAWQSRNRFERFFAILLNGARLLGDPGLTEALVRRKKEDLYDLAEHFDFAGGDFTELAKSFGRVLHSRRVEEALKADSTALEAFRADMQFQYAVLSFTHRVTVVMPGSVTGTNAPVVEGAQARWKDFIGLATIGDIDMWAESRVVNWWAVVVSGILVLAAIVGTVVGLTRRRVRAAAR